MNINKVTEIINQKGYEVEVKEITKGSTVKTGIIVGTGEVRPTIYPDYIGHVDVMTDEEIADKVIELYKTNTMPQFDASQIITPDYVKENMFVSVRRPINDGAFTKDFLDIQLVLRVDVNINGGAGSYIVRNELAEKLGFNESIFDEAVKNMHFEIKSLVETVKAMVGDEVYVPDCGMYVVSTPDRRLGSSAIYDKEFMKMAADKLGGDLVIIPSSIHELIFRKIDENVNFEDINQMVSNVNTVEVDIEEQLADHAYIYDRNTGIIKF